MTTIRTITIDPNVEYLSDGDALYQAEACYGVREISTEAAYTISLMHLRPLFAALLPNGVPVSEMLDEIHQARAFYATSGSLRRVKALDMLATWALNSAVAETPTQESARLDRYIALYSEPDAL